MQMFWFYFFEVLRSVSEISPLLYHEGKWNFHCRARSHEKIYWKQFNAIHVSRNSELSWVSRVHSIVIIGTISLLQGAPITKLYVFITKRENMFCVIQIWYPLAQKNQDGDSRNAEHEALKQRSTKGDVKQAMSSIYTVYGCIIRYSIWHFFENKQ